MIPFEESQLLLLTSMDLHEQFQETPLREIVENKKLSIALRIPNGYFFSYRTILLFHMGELYVLKAYDGSLAGRFITDGHEVINASQKRMRTDEHRHTGDS